MSWSFIPIGMSVVRVWDLLFADGMSQAIAMFARDEARFCFFVIKQLNTLILGVMQKTLKIVFWDVFFKKNCIFGVFSI